MKKIILTVGILLCIAMLAIGCAENILQKIHWNRNIVNHLENFMFHQSGKKIRNTQQKICFFM